jgi:hypothetical protein
MQRATFFVMLLLSVVTSPAIGDTLPQTAFNAWREYHEMIDERGVKIETRDTLDGKLYANNVYRWNADGASFESDMEAFAKNGLTAFVRNPRYAFRVAKEGDSSWVQQELILEAIDAKTLTTVIAFLTRETAQPALRGLLVYSTLLPDAIEAGSLSIESVRELNEVPAAIEVKIRGHADRDPRITVVRGTLKLAPNFMWMITEAHLELDNCQGGTGTMDSQLTYTTDTSSTAFSDLPALLTRTKSHQKWVTPKPISNLYESELRWKRDAPSRSDFRLTRYSLPEPPGFEEKPYRPSALVVVGGIALLVIGAVALALGAAAFQDRRAKVRQPRRS